MYDCTIRWRDGRPGVLMVTVSGFETPEDARCACEDLARGFGWHPRRWWEVWRMLEAR